MRSEGDESVKVSAIIPTYNRRSYIMRAIDSVLAQTVPVGEILVVDDGSTDATAEFLDEKYGARLRVIRQSNSGVSGARKRGIQEAKGDWIAFLDSDDEWMPGRNEQLLAAAAQVSDNVAWIFGDMQVITDRGGDSTLFGEHGLSVVREPQVFEDSLSVQFPFQFGLLQASFIRRSALLELNCFSIGLRSDDDLLAGFQVACRYRFAAIPAVVGKYYRTADLSASSVVVNGVYSADHFRSRMLSFGGVVESGRRRPWNLRYASEVQGLCRVLARQGSVPRRLVLQQFRYGGVSVKGLAFAVAGMLGRQGILAWDKLGKWRQKRKSARFLHAGSGNNLQAYAGSAQEKR
jgi:glycosyltransferase involved in cell wall biosynthesis